MKEPLNPNFCCGCAMWNYRCVAPENYPCENTMTRDMIQKTAYDANDVEMAAVEVAIDNYRKAMNEYMNGKNAGKEILAVTKGIPEQWYKELLFVWNARGKEFTVKNIRLERDRERQLRLIASVKHLKEGSVAITRVITNEKTLAVEFTSQMIDNLRSILGQMQEKNERQERLNQTIQKNK